MPRTILMLEHDEDDRYITQAVFDEHQYNVTLQFVTDKDEFFAELKKSSTKPSMILLNYHAGPTNAVDIITELRSTRSYRAIPVVVLSGSVSREVIDGCYAAGASSFIQKPSKSQDTDAKIGAFFQYWFRTVELPNA
jgi:CheY-like chemotaxis protein